MVIRGQREQVVTLGKKNFCHENGVDKKNERKKLKDERDSAKSFYLIILPQG